MTRQLRSPQSRYLQGFSLIELMISLALGLIILVAVLSAYTGAAAAAKMAEAQGRMYEDGQAALTILAQQLRMAGSNHNQPDRFDISIKNSIYTSRATLTGSIDPASSTTVPGVGTFFLTELTIGDRIIVSDETRTVTAIASNISLTVNTAFSDNLDEISPTVLYATPPPPYKLPVFSDPSVTPAFKLSDYSFRGCDGTFSNITAATSLDDLTCTTDNANPDSIALSYEADRFNTVPTTASPPLPTDCLGYALNKITAEIPKVPAEASIVPSTQREIEPPNHHSSAYDTADYYVADNRFYVATSSATPSLYCKGNGKETTAQPLVENIEDMQITYGVVKHDAEPQTWADQTVAGYLSAEKLNGEAGNSSVHNKLKDFSQQERWKKVITVRICLLVRSVDPVVSDLASARYFKCDGTLETSPPADRRLRHTYSTTVILRNRQH
jgi:type IV pilus assembly protein PilW